MPFNAFAANKTWMASKNSILLGIGVVCIVIVSWYVQQRLSLMKEYSVEALTAAAREDKNLFNNRRIEDAILNGQNLADGIKYGVTLENMVIRNLTMNNVQMWWAHFKNVTFVDCTFIKVDFSDSKFENVKFIRGEIYGYDRRGNATEFDVGIDRVLFDGVKIGKSVRLNLYGGIVVLRNVTATDEPGGYSMLHGSHLQVRMDNCTVTNRGVLNLGGDDNSAYITNCRFSNTMPPDTSTRGRWNPGLSLRGTAAWVENCSVLAGRTPGCKKTVITNCILGDAEIDDGGENSAVFLSKNKYVMQTGKDVLRLFAPAVDIQETAYLYLYANGVPIPQTVRIGTGNVNIYDTEISDLRMQQQNFKTALPHLNLLNVTIKKGDWEYADLRAGKWEHVLLGAPIDLNKAKIGTITGHYVNFIQGYPWRNGKLEIVDSSKPLEFDKPPVPTLEELGLAQFWKENDFPVEKY